MHRLLLLLLISACSLLEARASEATLSHFYAPDLAERQQFLHDRVTTHARNSEFDYALELSDRLLEQADELSLSRPTIYGQLLVNHGIVLTASDQFEEGLAYIDRGLAVMEQTTNPFSRQLINGVMAKAITELAMDRFAPAEDSFRRAQHITHRQGGVYAEEQLSMINYLTTTMLKQGDPNAADIQQLFSLRVAENVYGPESLELLPILDRLGGYFATRGSAIPPMVPNEIRLQRDALFKTSVEMYQRAVAIIEQNYGNNDLRLVHPLRGLASARMLQITNRKYAQAALERSLEIVETNPQSDTTDRAQALIDLGDLYVITADKRSSELYLQAWQMLQEKEETAALANSLFGTPMRLFPREDRVLYLDRQPDAVDPGQPLFINLEFTVTTLGTVTRVRVIDRNVPNDQVRMLRQRIRSSKYRPRIVDGELVTSEGLTLYQPFRVYKPSTELAAAQAASSDTAPETEPEDDSAVAGDEVP